MHQWDKQERVLFQLLLTVVEFINEPKHFNGIKNPRIVALTLYLQEQAKDGFPLNDESLLPSLLTCLHTLDFLQREYQCYGV